MKQSAAVLLVEDDREIARIVCDHLRKEEYHVTWASTGKEGWEDFKLGHYDLVLVDLMLPEVDGFTLCRSIRKESEVPMLIISARIEDESKIRGLDLGADDYVTKPFSLEELSARIGSHLRRYRRYQNQQDTEKAVSYAHGLSIDFSSKSVYLNKELLLLTAKEWELLCLLAKNPFEIFSKSALYEHVWQQEDVNGNNTVTVHIKSLRAKLKDDTRSSSFIQTVWGVGYRFIGEVL
ncbi:DNA-binding response regulator, OmpR family, contains REC and winged-helix (wHTH) domain [Paenibacillus uliginis N3/975]|uniref:DNA-binding response regulator, OmpR family, contains REC and winged-helix (WHTH) domain n=1 Tax=Paenibacillus uliginis N3/975 TaxID=1313296 RepID=A0A1X7GLY2_9BACL|nr:response regulator transcription factor [Paenibacillus uliginis]SMF71646.1 DNA-binding response regulator, OmpR family, contains REC and winged-helix (wHTH) domain [Paenibacillus uliginis N3/975]